MIRFFRQLRMGQMKHRAISKYLFYAIGEIFLVVIGILIALQVNNWNEQRLDKMKEISYLSGVKQDLESSLSELDRVIKKSSNVKNITTALLDIKPEKGINIPEEILDSMMFYAEGYTIFQPAKGTMQDLISSGNLNLLSNPSIRTKIATWEASFQMVVEREQLGKSEVQHLIDLHREVARKYEYRKYGNSLFNDAQRKRILQDPVFRNTYFGIRRNASILHILYLEKQEFINQMIEEIRQELDQLHGK